MSSAFTAREMTLLACALRSMETVPKLNYAKMAELAGMSNQNSAANAWREIRKKIDAVDENAETMADVTTPKTPKAAGRKRKTKDADGDDDAEMEATPKATGRKRKTKDADGDDDAEMEATPKKKRSRKPAAAKESGDVEAEKTTPGPKKGGRKPATPKGTPKVDETTVAKEVDGADPKMEDSEFAAYEDMVTSGDEV